MGAREKRKGWASGAAIPTWRTEETRAATRPSALIRTYTDAAGTSAAPPEPAIRLMHSGAKIRYTAPLRMPMPSAAMRDSLRTCGRRRSMEEGSNGVGGACGSITCSAWSLSSFEKASASRLVVANARKLNTSAVARRKGGGGLLCPSRSEGKRGAEHGRGSLTRGVVAQKDSRSQSRQLYSTEAHKQMIRTRWTNPELHRMAAFYLLWPTMAVSTRLSIGLVIHIPRVGRTNCRIFIVDTIAGTGKEMINPKSDHQPEGQRISLDGSVRRHVSSSATPRSECVPLDRRKGEESCRGRSCLTWVLRSIIVLIHATLRVLSLGLHPGLGLLSLGIGAHCHHRGPRAEATACRAASHRATEARRSGWNTTL